MEFDIRDKSLLMTNMRKNAPTPPGLPHQPRFCKIYGIKITDSGSEIISKKTSHKELKYFLYDRLVLHRNAFDLINWKLFEHMATIVNHLLQIWVGNFVSRFCGTNAIRYKRKEVPDPLFLCCNRPEAKETVLHQIHCPYPPSIRLVKDSVEP